MVLVSIDEARETAKRIISSLGHSHKDTDAIVKVLMYGMHATLFYSACLQVRRAAELRGNSQGLVKLTGSGLSMLVPDQHCEPISVIKQSPATLLLNGGLQPGIVVMHELLERGIPLARQSGVAVVGSCRTCTTTGAIGYFADAAARAGLVSLIFAGSPPAVATYGGSSRLFGTNPLAVGIPVANLDPIVLDMATSAMAYFAVMQAREAGALLPRNVAYDKSGLETRDPAAALEGALRTFDATPKSAALALVIEGARSEEMLLIVILMQIVLCLALTGPLVHAAFAGVGDRNNGETS